MTTLARWSHQLLKQRYLRAHIQKSARPHSRNALQARLFVTALVGSVSENGTIERGSHVEGFHQLQPAK